MIFKTIPSSIDKSRKALALFNKDWNIFKTNWQNASGGFKNKFATIFNNNDVNCLKEYNRQIQAGIKPSIAYRNTMMDCTKEAKQNAVAIAKGTKTYKQAITSMNGMTISARAASVALNAVSIAGNMILFTAIAKGVQILIDAIDKLHISSEEYLEQQKEIISKSEEIISSTESEIDALESLQKKLEETNGSQAEMLKLADEISDTLGKGSKNILTQANAYAVLTAKIEANLAAQKRAKNSARADKNEALINSSKGETIEKTSDKNNIKNILDKYWWAARTDDKDLELQGNYEAMGEFLSKHYLVDFDYRGIKTEVSPYSAEEWTEYFKNQVDYANQYFEDYLTSDTTGLGGDVLKEIIKGLVSSGYTIGNDVDIFENIFEQLENNAPKLDALWTEYANALKNGETTSNIKASIDKIFANIISDNQALGSIFNTYFTDMVVSLREAVKEQIETAKEFNILDTISETIDHLDKKVKPVMDSLKSAYQDIFTEDGFTLDNVGVDMLNSVKESIAEINEAGANISTSAFEDFAKVLTNTETTEEQAHKAFNDLVGDIINGTNSLNVSSEAVDVLVQSLEEMGVTNAKEVVNEMLSIKENLNKLSDEAQGEVKVINDTLGDMGKEAVTSTNDLTECTWEEIEALMSASNTYGFTADKIKEYAAQKIWSNQNSLDVSQDISQLLVVAKSAGIATKAIARYEEAKKLQKQGYGGGQGQVDALMKSAYQEVLDEIQTLYNFELPEYKPKDSKSDSKYSKDTTSDIDWIETKLNNVDKALDRLNNTIDNTYSNWTDRSNALKDAIIDTEKAIGLQEQAYDKYMQKAESIKLPEYLKERVRLGDMSIQNDVNSETKELIDEYSEWYEKAQEAKEAQDELNQSLLELKASDSVDMIEEYYDAIDEAHSNSIESIQNKIDKAETMGFFANGSYYDNIGEELAKQKANLEKKKADLDKVLANSGLDKNSSSYTELQNLIGSISNEIQQLTIDIEDNKNAAQENEWNYFDYLRESVTRLIEEADFFIELISNEDLFDDKGNFTKYADATLALHNSNYEIYMANAREYAEEMKALEDDLADGKDVIDRYRELEDAQRDAIKSAQDECKSILSLIEEGYQKQLDYLNEIIDKKKESLTAEKDLFNYQKSIQEKSDKVSSLKRQLSVYEGLSDEESKAMTQKLSVELQKAEDDLAETEYEKMINDTEQMLDALSSEYEEWMNARLDNEDELLRQIQDKLGENGDINSTLKEISDKYGVSMTDSLKTAIVDGKPFDNVTIAIEKLVEKITSLVGGSNSDGSSNTPTDNTKPTTNTDVKQPTTNSNQPSQPIDTQSKSETDSIFIPQKSVYPKDKLDKERSIEDRLKYYDYASDFSSRAIYYKKLGGSGAYTGSGTQNSWLLKKMKEVGYASGTNYAKAGLHWTQENGDELIIRKSDGALLTPLGMGDKVVNSDGTSNLFTFANDPQGFLEKLGVLNYAIPAVNVKLPDTSVLTRRNTTNSATIGNVNIEVGQVVANDPMEFAKQMRLTLANDRNTQKMVQELGLGQSLGHNSMNVKRYL